MDSTLLFIAYKAPFSKKHLPNIMHNMPFLSVFQKRRYANFSFL